MSRLVVSYNDLDDVIKSAKKTAIMLEEYAETLESEVSNKLRNYSGEWTNNIDEADDLIHEKLKQLRQKEDDFQTLAYNMGTFKNSCMIADNNVKVAIESLSGNFKNTYGMKENIFTNFFTYVGTEITNSNALTRFLKSKHDNIEFDLPDITEEIKNWYKEGKYLDNDLVRATIKMGDNVVDFIKDQYENARDNIKDGIADGIEEAKAFIPRHVSNNLALDFYDFISLPLFAISQDRINKNYEKNTEYFKENSSDLLVQGEDGKNYIEHQEKKELFGNLDFGLSDINSSGCGIIATYNALVNLNSSVSDNLFPDLIKYYEKKGIAAKGFLGNNPNAIKQYFDENGYKTKMITSTSESDFNQLGEDYEAIIVTIYNDRYDITEQAHTVAITKYDRQYYSHNLDDIVNGEPSFYESITNNNKNERRKIISAIGISKEQKDE
ncbi:peptidase C39-like protein [Mobilisporobacter senegalensis]|uniref:Peptidase C39-like protein n=1 Tax=Mobilisporobacter senegalensis TaxID=1329262 RepID=A0A3N1XYY9_9FIRM|nr:C39 family peptidase [Mobilisporobacter senegalensis]ROR31461.1 peptidase C39-like protein [Mobilisporobacter senegalensis]